MQQRLGSSQASFLFGSLSSFVRISACGLSADRRCSHATISSRGADGDNKLNYNAKSNDMIEEQRMQGGYSVPGAPLGWGIISPFDSGTFRAVLGKAGLIPDPGINAVLSDMNPHGASWTLGIEI